MKTVMMAAVSLIMISGSIASASISANASIASQKLDPNIPENHIVDANFEKPCPNMVGGRRDKGAIQMAGVATPVKATVRSGTVNQ